MTMGSVSYLEEVEKDLARKLHRLSRLGVRLECSLDRGDIVYHNLESSLVVAVKSKQHLDLALMQLK